MADYEDRWRTEQQRRPRYDEDRDRWRSESEHREGGHRGSGFRGYGREDYGGYGREDYGREDRERYGGESRGYGGYAGLYRGGEYPGRGYRGDYGREEYGREEYGRGSPGQGDWGRQGYYGPASRHYTGRGAEHGRQERGWWDRTADELASWFGDEDAERRRRQDEIRETHHRGRGPRGYVRSDDRIREDVNDRLTDDPYVDASEIDISVSGGEVTLNGTVESRWAKRRAEDLADDVSGVGHVQNNLRVRRETSTTAGASAMAGMGATGSTAGSTAETTSGATSGATTGTTKTRTP